MGQNRAENFSKPTPFFPPKCYDFHTKNRRKTALLSHFQRKTAFSRFTVALFSFYMKDHIDTLDKLAKAFDLSIADFVRPLGGTRDDSMQSQLRATLEDFVQKIDAIYKK